MTTMNMNMTAVDAKNYMEFNTTIAENILSAIKKYFTENSETIVAGLAAMSGQVYIPASRR